MSQRKSGYERELLDQYETPAWVTRALIPHLPEINGVVWEPACGSGKMVATFAASRFRRDRQQHRRGRGLSMSTNEERHRRDHHQSALRSFIERALSFDSVRVVAMLLRTDFDHAATRAHLFAGCPTFAKKVVLTKRIRWFEDSNGSRRSGRTRLIGGNFRADGASPSALRLKRTIATTMLAIWMAVAAMQNVAAARIGAVIAAMLTGAA
jgi:hypothetical protein